MSSAFQTGLFSGGPLGLFWGWNVGMYFKIIRLFAEVIAPRFVVCLCFS